MLLCRAKLAHLGTLTKVSRMWFSRLTYRFAIALTLAAAVAGAAYLRWQPREAPRPRYVLVNETGRHDFDLAFRMSLKLAEQKSGIENALVLLPHLPPGRTIEETAAEQFSRFRIGQRRNGRGILYLYSARENLLKIEVSYALEGDIPDIYCHHLEEAARSYMLSEIPQDFISELIITTNLRGVGATRGSTQWSSPQWLTSDFLSGGAGALVHGYGKTLAEYDAAIRRLPQTQLREYAPAPDVSVSVEHYLASLAAGIRSEE